MPKYIADTRLNSMVSDFIATKPKTLDCYADFHFGGDVARFPIEAKDGKAFEATFCEGYKKKKYLAALSAQVGCAAGCSFCELGYGGLKRNLSSDEIVDQLRVVLSGAYKRGYDIFSKPVKATFVMGGDPLANKHFPEAMQKIAEQAPLQFKLSSVLPDFPVVWAAYDSVVEIASEYPNITQMQVSLNSTDEKYRQSLSRAPMAGFEKVREVGEKWASSVPNARKVNLTFTLTRDTPMNTEHIKDILPKELFAIRLRECVPTDAGKKNGVEPVIEGRVSEIWKRFEDAGYMIIPGSPGKSEWRFRLSPGQMLNMYRQMKG